MEKFSKNKEAIPKFEVRVSSNSDKDRIIEKLSAGGLIQFIVTKSGDIWLTDKGHDNLRFKDNILWEDINLRGYFFMKSSGISITYDELLKDKDRAAGESIRDTILNFIK